MATCAPGLKGIAEWWKQLFGESEGKGGGGVFPACMSYTTDLHSLGQWMQEGDPIAFETAMDVAEGSGLTVPCATGLCAHLEGRALHGINRKVLEAALKAHADGGTPCARIALERLGERELGGLIYMMEYACAVSAYAQGVNPFDQPGVEKYKDEARALLTPR
jgi:glucose-6-phosphate isomerase